MMNLIPSGRVGGILFDTLKSNTKKLKCFGLLSSFKNHKSLNQMHSSGHWNEMK